MRTSSRKTAVAVPLLLSLLLAGACTSTSEPPAPIPTPSAVASLVPSAASSPEPPARVLDLLDRLNPRLILDSREQFGPVPIETLTLHPDALLKRESGTVIAPGAVGWKEFLRSGTYSGEKPVRSSDIITVSADVGGWVKRGDGHKVRSRVYDWPTLGRDGHWYLNYVWFYVSNDWAPAFTGSDAEKLFSPSDHEGDFEIGQVKLDRAARKPLELILSQHTSAEPIPWKDVELDEDGRPIVYPRWGTHAGHPGPLPCDPTADYHSLRDCSNGEGFSVVPQAERLGPQRWLEWPGHLGDTVSKLWGSPTGPGTRAWWKDPTALRAS